MVKLRCCRRRRRGVDCERMDCGGCGGREGERRNITTIVAPASSTVLWTFKFCSYQLKATGAKCTCSEPLKLIAWLSWRRRQQWLAGGDQSTGNVFTKVA